MSHIIRVKNVIVSKENLDLFQKSVEKVGGKYEGLKVMSIYTTEALGHHFQLPGWRYTVCVGDKTGTLKYDNFKGAWGDPRILQKTLQDFTAQAAVREAEKQGFHVSSQEEEAGNIKIKMYRL